MENQRKEQWHNAYHDLSTETGYQQKITEYPVFHFMIVSICSDEFHRLCRHVLLEIEGNGVFY